MGSCISVKNSFIWWKNLCSIFTFQAHRIMSLVRDRERHKVMWSINRLQSSHGCECLGCAVRGESSRRHRQDDSDSVFGDHNHDLLHWILIYSLYNKPRVTPQAELFWLQNDLKSSASSARTRCRHQLLVIADYFNKHARNDFCHLTTSQTSRIDETVIYWIW